jgi:SAM-dependent methyltransferase
MPHESAFTFAARSLADFPRLKGAQVLEVGIGPGSVRPLAVRWGASSYLGVNAFPGPGVDVVCPVESLATKLGENAADLVICTEVVEHVQDWRAAISNMKRVLREGGRLILTTRSRGYPWHGAPLDYWRYGIDDMRNIFRDFDDLVVEPDPQEVGVFVSGSKPVAFQEANLSSIALYSIVTGKREGEIDSPDLRRWKSKARVRYAQTMRRVEVVYKMHPRIR